MKKLIELGNFCVGRIDRCGITNFIVVAPDDGDHKWDGFPWIVMGPSAARRIGVKIVRRDMTALQARIFVQHERLARLVG